MRNTLSRDLLASLVVFLVALPLCMGIAIASGAPVAAGLVTGVIGGILVGILAGAPLQVSGPAAGLTVICAEVIAKHGLAALGVVVMISGAIQLVVGLLKLGQWFRAVAPAVIQGMLAGIGVLIFSSQFHVMLDDRPTHGGWTNLVSIPEAILKGLPLPDNEPREARRLRLELLQSMGALHERQIEIADHVERLVSRHDTLGQQAALQQLEPYLPLQVAILTDLREARAKLEQQPALATASEKGAATLAAMQFARRSVAAAQADLERGSLASAAESQRRSAVALGDVLASLKSHDWAAKVGLMTIAIIILWQSFAVGRLKVVPGPLLAVACVTWIAWAGSLPVLYVEVPERLIDGLTFPALHVLSDVPLRELMSASILMAVSASAQTLLCASALDRIQTGPRTQYDRELAAHGLGNLLCGMVGALPIAGVIVRSATNVQAGATTRISTILHGVWILLFVTFFSGVLRLIPTAALAGILVYTGFRLIDFRGLVHLWKTDRVDALIFLATVAFIVVDDLLFGVMTGLVLSAMKLLWTFSRLDVRTTKNADGGLTVQVFGAATFLRLPILAARLEAIEDDAPVTIDVSRLSYVDQACFDLLINWAKQRRSIGAVIELDRERLESQLRGMAQARAEEPRESAGMSNRRKSEAVEMSR